MFVLSKAVLGSEHTAVELMNLEKSQAPAVGGCTRDPKINYVQAWL